MSPTPQRPSPRRGGPGYASSSTACNRLAAAGRAANRILNGDPVEPIELLP